MSRLEIAKENYNLLFLKTWRTIPWNWQRNPKARTTTWLQCCEILLWTRNSQALSHSSECTALCQKFSCWSDEGRKLFYYRADDCRRILQRRVLARRLDSCHSRWTLVCSIWANFISHWHWLWNFNETPKQGRNSTFHGQNVDSSMGFILKFSYEQWKIFEFHNISFL